MSQEAERNRLAARRRPTRAEIEPAALALLQRHGAAIMATARRFAATPEDAEDAYQRGVEILLTKAPTTAEEELVPWLRTVVKHEAWAIRRQRERAAPVADDGEVPEPPTEGALTHDQAERLDRLRLGAEAMRQLKPQEVRALLLRAEGYSYKQIQDITGWTYTKVNRCLTEGRRAFLDRVAGIEAGGECERLSPLLSKLVDGEATADDLAALRPHVRTCLTCRAALREYRAAPATAAALLPAAVLFAQPRSGLLDAPARLLETLAGWSQKAHATIEMASAQKVAAVAASTAVLAGGGAATVKQVEREPERPQRAAAEPHRAPRDAAAGAAAVVVAPATPATRQPVPVRRGAARRAPAGDRERRAKEIERAAPPVEREFEPAFAASAPSPQPRQAAAAGSAPTAAPAPAPPPAPPAGGGAEEFAP
jgi:RNA polymerase sigma factor (sigma-70 family)